MFAFFQRMPFLSKARHDYQKVQFFSERSSSDDLHGPSDGLLGDKEIRQLPQKRSFWRRWWPFIVIHSAIFAIYLGVLYAVASNGRAQAIRGPGLVFCEPPVKGANCTVFYLLTAIAPAHEAVIYEEVKFQENSQEHGPFSGYPRDEIDQNWHDLLNGE
jgi:hypothetical protein